MSNQSDNKTAGQSQESGPWDPALATLREWDPAWAEACVKMTTNPWTSGVLPHKFIELVSVALNAACTNLNPDGTRRHIPARSKRERFVKRFSSCSSAWRSCRSIRAALAPRFCWRKRKPRAWLRRPSPRRARRPAMRCGRADNGTRRGDPFFELEPQWTDEFFAAAIPMYKSGVMPAKELELLSIACELLHAHVRAGHTTPHQAALNAGATME